MKNQRRVTKRPPLAIGTGLVAVDVVVEVGDSSPPMRCMGGTCGNVLLALRYLGFDAAPVCRLQDDPAGKLILSEFRAWGVRTGFVTTDSDGSSPVIVQTVCPGPGGIPSHRFSWRCPHCGARLPGYKPVLTATAEVIAAEMPPPQVFFFDRVNRGALVLAAKAAELGAVVVFEPSGVGDPALFREAWAAAHVIKYSHERLSDLPDGLDAGPHLILQVETLGADGLRYRARFGKRVTSPWKSLRAFQVPAIRDTAGAGDWCTAGLLYRLAPEGAEGFRRASAATVEAGLRFGQAMAAWNCGFLGARGGMGQATAEECLAHVARILDGNLERGESGATAHRPADEAGFWCRACGDVETPAEVVRVKPKRTTA